MDPGTQVDAHGLGAWLVVCNTREGLLVLLVMVVGRIAVRS